MKTIALLTGLSLALISTLTAQQGPAMEGVDAGRRAWVVAAHMPENGPNPLPVLSDKKLHQVKLFARDVGDPIAVDETGVVRAVKAVTGPNGKVAYQNLAVAQLEKGVREALIVLVPDSKSSGLSFKSKVIDLAKFKRGGCLCVNLVNTNIAVEIDDKRMGLRPGQMNFINTLGENKQKVARVSFYYEVSKNSKPEYQLMTSSRMPFYQSRREICIFFYNKDIENVDFRGIAFPAPMPRVAQRER